MEMHTGVRETRCPEKTFGSRELRISLRIAQHVPRETPRVARATVLSGRGDEGGPLVRRAGRRAPPSASGVPTGALGPRARGEWAPGALLCERLGKTRRAPSEASPGTGVGCAVKMSNWKRKGVPPNER